MSNFEELLQERLEQLEAGELLETCLVGLSPEEASLLQMAASLRELPFPQASPTAVAEQRAQLLQTVEKENPMQQNNHPASFWEWLRSTLTTLPGAAVALAALVVLIWLSFTLSRPDNPRTVQTALISKPNIAETSPGPNVAAEDSPDVATIGENEENSQEETGEEGEEGTESNVATSESQPFHLAYLPNFQISPFISARAATLQELVGLVEIQDKEGNWEVATLGTAVEAGQRIRTGALSNAKILFYDGSQTTLAANTEISIDRLNAQQPQDGARIIVMTQWVGESEHQVASRNDGDSLYEVNTPNGSGIAKGTVFQVMVTVDLFAYYTVIEGQVDVTNLNVTVIVLPGQITIINPNQVPSTPYFMVNGQGEVTAVGPNWEVGGQTFTTNNNTLIIGNPQLGDIVQVTGYMLPDGTLVATIITLITPNPANHFSLTGEATAIFADSWIVAGQTISITTGTIIDSAIALGDTVAVQGIILPDGTLIAESIDLVDSNYPFEFVGIVSAIGADIWTISGVEIAIDQDTGIESGIVVGDVVHVAGTILSDGTWLAYTIELVEDDADFEFTGTVNSIGPWVVAGIGFEVDVFTQIEAGIVVGSLVHVEGQVLADGTWLATSITLIHEDEEITVTFIGTVNSINPWVINGITLTTDVDTVIATGIQVGDTVLVTAVILPDGTFLALTIQLITVDTFPVGCFTIATTVLGVSGNVITLTGLPAITLDDNITVQGTLVVNTIIIINYCIGQDGTITVITIIVIYNLPTPAPVPTPVPPPGGGNGGGGGGGGRVTICHKGRNTLTLPQSALGGHLGHGDTIGACN